MLDYDEYRLWLKENGLSGSESISVLRGITYFLRYEKHLLNTPDLLSYSTTEIKLGVSSFITGKHLMKSRFLNLKILKCLDDYTREELIDFIHCEDYEHLKKYAYAYAKWAEQNESVVASRIFH